MGSKRRSAAVARPRSNRSSSTPPTSKAPRQNTSETSKPSSPPAATSPQPSVAARFDGGDTLATQREADRLRELVRAASFLGAGRIEVRLDEVPDRNAAEPALSALAERARREGVETRSRRRRVVCRLIEWRRSARSRPSLAWSPVSKPLAPRSNSTRRRRIWRLTSFISRISTATSTAEPFSTSAPGRECSRWRPPSVVPARVRDRT